MAEFPEGSLKEFDLEGLRGTRCRMQRLSDLKFFSGWIRESRGQSINVELVNSNGISADDQFQIEAAVDTANVRFQTSVESIAKCVVSLHVSGKPELSMPGQEARYRTQGITASLYGLEKPVDADAADISMSGIGLLSYDQAPRFAMVRMIVRGSAAAIECTGRVRYCRPNPEFPGSFRIGVQVEFEDRLSRSMWQRLVLSCSAAEAKVA